MYLSTCEHVLGQLCASGMKHKPRGSSETVAPVSGEVGLGAGRCQLTSFGSSSPGRRRITYSIASCHFDSSVSGSARLQGGFCHWREGAQIFPGSRHAILVVGSTW